MNKDIKYKFFLRMVDNKTWGFLVSAHNSNGDLVAGELGFTLPQIFRYRRDAVKWATDNKIDYIN